MADPKLEQLAAIGAEDPEYQTIVNHTERNTRKPTGKQLRITFMKGDFTKLGLQTFLRGKLIVNDGSNVMIPSQARKCILKELHSTHLGPDMMKNIYSGRFF